MSVLKIKNASGNWQAVDALVNGEFRFVEVEPLDVSTGIIGYDLSQWVGVGANFLFIFACDLNSSATSGDWDTHVIYQFDGEFSGLMQFNQKHTHNDLSMSNETIFEADSTFDIDYNQETRVLSCTSTKYGEDITGGCRAFNAVLFYCG